MYLDQRSGVMPMTMPSAIHLNLPPDLYARITDAAQRSNRPVEDVLIESLAVLFGAPSVDWDQLAVTLDALPDAELLALVHRRMSWVERARLGELTAQGKQTPLSDEEEAELAALIDEADRMTVLRSHALYALHERGHNVEQLLRPRT